MVFNAVEACADGRSRGPDLRDHGLRPFSRFGTVFREFVVQGHPKAFIRIPDGPTALPSCSAGWVAAREQWFDAGNGLMGLELGHVFPHQPSESGLFVMVDRWLRHGDEIRIGGQARWS